MDFCTVNTTNFGIHYFFLRSGAAAEKSSHLNV